MINFALVNRMMQAYVWLRRIRHCQGFGIQSPTDFSFVKDVVNEQQPYYAYSEVGQGDDWLRRKLGQLYLRLANYVQPAVITDLVGYADYLLAGCHKAHITSHLAASKAMDSPSELRPSLIIAPADDAGPQLLSCCGKETMLVVENIGRHQQQWKELEQWPQVRVTFDLYYCGIATFNPQRAKQHYVVNF